jgi:hypothetical protein
MDMMMMRRRKRRRRDSSVNAIGKFMVCRMSY